jgi:hypothetical protein
MPLHLGIDAGTGEPIRLPEEDLLRHVVVLGATGSGKTVLGKVILEEAVRAGVPVVAVDSQGDLASLALAATEESVALHSAPQDAIDEYWSCAAIAILTPGSKRGTARSLNPLKDPPFFESAEDRVLYLDALAEGLASAIGYTVSGDTGSRAKDAIYIALQGAWEVGKWPREVSALPEILAKEPADDGALLTRKERAALVRRAKAMTVGAKGLLFTAGPTLDVENMVSWAPRGQVPVNVVYTGGLRSPSEREMVVATLCEDVYHWMISEPSGDLRLVVYIDEVAGLCPPHPKNPPAKKFLSLLFRQARKYGVGLVVATQNVTDLDYKALGQANTWALGRLLAKQDLDRVRHLVSSLHPTDSEAILEAIPSLKTGQFVVLSPEHLGQIQIVQVRGLATQHVVVPEEKFREIQSTHALVTIPPPEDERASRRKKLAAAATRAARSSAKVEAEEKLGLRILGLFDELPGLYGLEEIAARIPADERFIGILLRKLEEARLLRLEHIDGRDVYWDPAVGFDLRRGIPSHMAWLPLRFPLVKASKRAKETLRRRMFIFPRERLARKAFYYAPMWRVEAEVSLGKRGGRAARQFYVNAVTGEVARSASGQLTYEEFPRRDGSSYESLVPKGLLERGSSGRIEDPVPLVRLGPVQAQEVVRRSFGARPDPKETELVLLPVWRFEIESLEDGHMRPIWIDGTLGTALRSPPEGL